MSKVERPTGIRVPPPSVEPSREPESRYIPDSRLTFIRAGQQWMFDASRILLDGEDVSRLIGDERQGPQVWMGIAEGLVEYRKRVEKADREVTGYSKFSALIEALLVKIMGQLRRVYNEKIFGLKWRLEDGQFLLNGVNIRSFMALYRLRPTPKAGKFLRGLRKKLKGIQAGERGTGDYEKVRGVVDDLVAEIDETLVEEPPVGLADPGLPPGSPRR